VQPHNILLSGAGVAQLGDLDQARKVCPRANDARRAPGADRIGNAAYQVRRVMSEVEGLREWG